MNLVEKIKADIEINLEPFSCHNYAYALASIGNINQQSKKGYQVNQDTATIKVRGFLVPKTDDDYSEFGVTGYNWLNEYLEKASNDPFVKNIVLDVDSNGGYVRGLSNVLEKIAKLDKPITAHVTGNAYSSAYWLISGVSHIKASKDSGIGSIGAYVLHSEQSKALENDGTKFSLFRSGTWKNAFNWFMPLSSSEKQRLQQSVDTLADGFFSDVSANRNIDKKIIHDWQGDSFTAEQALQLGLIDEISDQASQSTKTQSPAIAGFFIESKENPKMIEELEELKAQLSQKDEALAKVEAEKASLAKALSEKEEELNEYKASQRKAQIEALGKEFSDDEIKALNDMSDSQFALFINASQKPQLPQGLDKAQATSGIDSQSIDDKVKAWYDKS